MCGIEPTLHCRFTAQHYLHTFLRTAVLPNIRRSFELLCCIQITLLSFWPLVCLTPTLAPVYPPLQCEMFAAEGFQSEHIVQGCAVRVVRVSRCAMQVCPCGVNLMHLCEGLSGDLVTDVEVRGDPFEMKMPPLVSDHPFHTSAIMLHIAGSLQ